MAMGVVCDKIQNSFCKKVHWYDCKTLTPKVVFGVRLPMIGLNLSYLIALGTIQWIVTNYEFGLMNTK